MLDQMTESQFLPRVIVKHTKREGRQDDLWLVIVTRRIGIEVVIPAATRPHRQKNFNRKHNMRWSSPSLIKFELP